MTRKNKLLSVRFERRVRQSVWLPAVLLLFGMGIYFALVSILVQVSSPQTAAAASAPVDATSNTIPGCVPTPSQAPAFLDLSNAPTGLTTQVDPIASYQIYGNTADQLRTQIQQCAPGASGAGGAEYTGETTYVMNWQYTAVGSTTCTVTNVKVGLHITTALPLWQPIRSATNGLDSRWQSFMNALTAHETGHATLDKQYAAVILQNLNALPAMECAQVDANVKRVVHNEVVLLNQANDTYDATTNHGATQGAILPIR